MTELEAFGRMTRRMLLGAGLATLARPALTQPSGLPWRSGFRGGDSSPATLRAVGTWRGRAVDLAHVFVGSEVWRTYGHDAWRRVP